MFLFLRALKAVKSWLRMYTGRPGVLPQMALRLVHHFGNSADLTSSHLFFVVARNHFCWKNITSYTYHRRRLTPCDLFIKFSNHIQYCTSDAMDYGHAYCITVSEDETICVPDHLGWEVYPGGSHSLVSTSLSIIYHFVQVRWLFLFHPHFYHQLAVYSRPSHFHWKFRILKHVTPWSWCSGMGWMTALSRVGHVLLIREGVLLPALRAADSR